MNATYHEWTIAGVHLFWWLFWSALVLGAAALVLPAWPGRRRGRRAEATLDVHPLLRVCDAAETQRRLRALAGVEAVRVNADRAAAFVRYDPSQVTVDELRRFVSDCAHHCWGERAPNHVCPGEATSDASAAGRESPDL